MSSSTSCKRELWSSDTDARGRGGGLKYLQVASYFDVRE